jgi:hypothetical protein
MAKKCQNGECSFEMMDEFVFCPKCGKEQQVICPNCQKAIMDSTFVFCPACGFSLKVQEAVAEAVAEAGILVSDEESSKEVEVEVRDPLEVETGRTVDSQVPGQEIPAVEESLDEGKTEVKTNALADAETEVEPEVVADAETEVEQESSTDEDEDEFTFEEPESVSADGDDEMNEAIMAMDGGGEAEEGNKTEETVDEEVTDEEEVVDTAGLVEETVVSEEENVPEEEAVDTADSAEETVVSEEENVSEEEAVDIADLAEETVTPEEREEVVAELVYSDIQEEYPSGDPLDKKKILAQCNPMSDEDAYENPLKTGKKEIDWLKVVAVIIALGGFLTAVGIIICKVFSF